MDSASTLHTHSSSFEAQPSDLQQWMYHPSCVATTAVLEGSPCLHLKAGAVKDEDATDKGAFHIQHWLQQQQEQEQEQSVEGLDADACFDPLDQSPQQEEHRGCCRSKRSMDSLSPQEFWKKNCGIDLNAGDKHHELLSVVLGHEPA